MFCHHRASKIFTLLILLCIAACSSTPPAPVVDRLPSEKPESTSNTAIKKPNELRPTYKTGDWRPGIYTVKKGDTLFSIGLEYGYDYKEIAEFNQINTPYSIKIGQLLKFKPSNTNQNEANADGVTTVPLGAEENPITIKSGEVAAQPTATVLLLQGPKANREPYSEEAFNKVVSAVPKIVVTSITTVAKNSIPSNPIPSNPNTPINPVAEEKISKPITESNTDASTKYETSESVDWSWPHNGKVTAWFNENTNKGLDITGSMGQSVNAAAAGKVIYSGSDLRGYGKLVIIKHNPLYLSVYAHNSMITVKEGQLVSRGQKIAEMGNTESNTVKLHFEIRRQGKSVDPKLYLPAI